MKTINVASEKLRDRMFEIVCATGDRFRVRSWDGFDETHILLEKLLTVRAPVFLASHMKIHSVIKDKAGLDVALQVFMR